jgi:predicted component of type VI protein secretion system
MRKETDMSSLPRQRALILSPRWGFFAIFMLLLLLITGCSGKSSKKYTVLDVTGFEDLNSNQPVCLVVRTLTQKDYFVKSYDDIADMVYADPQDESLLAWRMILPGEKLKIEVEQPETGHIGIYSLFTNPGGHWKLMLNSPFEKKYKISVSTNNLEAPKSGGLWPF